MKVLVKKAEKFGWKGIKGWSVNFDNFTSTSYIEVETNIPLRKNIKNDRMYFVVEGEVDFTVNNEKFKLNKKEAIFIPKNTKYSYKPVGKLKLVEANIPPFDGKGEIIVGG